MTLNFNCLALNSFHSVFTHVTYNGAVRNISFSHCTKQEMGAQRSGKKPKDRTVAELELGLLVF